MYATRFAVFLGLAVIAAGQNLDFNKAEREIVRLPPTAFRLLPPAIAHELRLRGCTIPQEEESKKPNNVVTGQFAKRGQKDWAVLCSIRGASSILVFWNGSATHPAELAHSDDKVFLQGLGGDKIGFSRGIGAVGRDFILERHKAYGGPKPPPIDHEGVNDAFLGKASAVHYFFAGKWMTLSGAD